jgi:hypothetical protein
VGDEITTLLGFEMFVRAGGVVGCRVSRIVDIRGTTVHVLRMRAQRRAADCGFTGTGSAQLVESFHPLGN